VYGGAEPAGVRWASSGAGTFSTAPSQRGFRLGSPMVVAPVGVGEGGATIAPSSSRSRPGQSYYYTSPRSALRYTLVTVTPYACRACWPMPALPASQAGGGAARPVSIAAGSVFAVRERRLDVPGRGGSRRGRHDRFISDAPIVIQNKLGGMKKILKVTCRPWLIQNP
jgi:hypothetical protein